MEWILIQHHWDLTFLTAFCSSSPGRKNVQVLAINTLNRYSLIEIFHDTIPEVIHLNIGFKIMPNKAFNFHLYILFTKLNAQETTNEKLLNK